jgi:zinc transport system substrate-binding protein
MRTGLLLLSLVLAAPLAAACGDDAAGNSGKPRVVAAVYPLRFVAERIAGEQADVVDLTPAGEEPHDIELTADQIVEVTGADLLIYVDEGFQPALEDVVPDAQGQVFDVLDSVDVIETAGQVDPHVWLDPSRLSSIASLTAPGLAGVDVGNRGVYVGNLGPLARDLHDLDSDYRETLDDCKRRELVTAHEAFGYLADRYDLEQIGIAGVDPEAEPSPQRLVEIAEFVRENDVTTIFFEELVAPDVAETIADETGATTATLYTLESPPEEGDYLSAMRENLATLKTALGCSS